MLEQVLQIEETLSHLDRRQLEIDAAMEQLTLQIEDCEEGEVIEELRTLKYLEKEKAYLIRVEAQLSIMQKNGATTYVNDDIEKMPPELVNYNRDKQRELDTNLPMVTAHYVNYILDIINTYGNPVMKMDNLKNAVNSVTDDEDALRDELDYINMYLEILHVNVIESPLDIEENVEIGAAVAVSTLNKIKEFIEDKLSEIEGM